MPGGVSGSAKNYNSTTVDRDREQQRIEQFKRRARFAEDMDNEYGDEGDGVGSGVNWHSN